MKKGGAALREFGLSVVYVAFLGITAQIIGVRLPRRWFDAGKFPYAAFAFETDGRVYTRRCACAGGKRLFRI